MKILYIIDFLGKPGGMERVLSTKVNYLCDQLNHEITIISRNALPKDLFFNYSNNVKIISLNLTKNCFKNYETKLAEYLSTNKQDVVIGLFGSELPFLYKLKDGSKKIQEFHFSKNYLIHLVNHLPNIRLRFLRKVKANFTLIKERYYAKKYDALVLLSKRDQELWGATYNSFVIPNPLSFQTKEKSSVTNKKIISIGRLIAQKGFDDLIKAFSTIHYEIEGWTLEIIGEGQDYEYLQSLIFKMGLKGKVKISSPLKDIQTALIDSSIFVFPSKYEGFGLVLTEAMECGLPSIAYDCECGPSEIIRHGEDGFLVPLSDIDSLAKHIKILALDFSRRKEMSTNAVKNVKRFYGNAIMNYWEDLFKTLNKDLL
ncbi:glycosyltransferase family 4 protein [Algoriphagus kandeliae]|uniref:glycosyltransferase family 4 protein n=1 Tax=Algoriphagus kandeliae TaxID=2562278 RepID=UPI001386FC30|nr:glycosyltransferase family 4 protein [Algoriphagus kandeliae]